MRVLWRYLIEVPGKALIVLVRIYQYLLSPLVGQNCRFHPTCSNYMIAAVQKYGAVRGGLRGIGRICRCHPWNSGGIDLP